MNGKKKFENFLESLKGKGQDQLIESIKSGFQACYENADEDKARKGICPLCNAKGLKEIDRFEGGRVAAECPSCGRELEYMEK